MSRLQLVLCGLLLIACGSEGWFSSRRECSGTLFNSFTHFCCSDTLHEKTGFNDCCLGELYDKRTAFCWIGLRLTSYILKCSGKPYHYRKEKCCGGQIMPTFDPTVDCCDGQIIDTSKFVCQKGNIKPL
ncbi:hypothetical protein NP493_121g00002 [Ridgeia piscesae]|uniref:Galaxin-like repeats domain-containing protein n=1 Tax=Ridgeia piscesae TaxID=27915 RepID=A0AAD9P5Z0_RIDPI|nr:hypothetical protein NP493_121g00002 [Ridgeia piscesae]